MVAKALQFLSSLREERPDLASDLDELCVLYEGKLWHQLSLKLESIVDSDGFKIGEALIRLYKHFVSDFGEKLNPLKLAQFAVSVSERLIDVDERIGFLESVQKGLKDDARMSTRLTTAVEPSMFVEMAILQDKLLKGEIDQSKRALNEAKETLEQLKNVEHFLTACTMPMAMSRWILW